MTRTGDRERRVPRKRLALLTAAALIAAAIESAREASRGDVVLLPIIAGAIVIFLLVIVRLLALVRQNERAVVRERVLRHANLALAQAPTPDERRPGMTYFLACFFAGFLTGGSFGTPKPLSTSSLRPAVLVRRLMKAAASALLADFETIAIW